MIIFMKKDYVKPEIHYESFVLSQHLTKTDGTGRISFDLYGGRCSVRENDGGTVV